MAETIVVFGATGHQGFSVAEGLSCDSAFKVRAAVRDPSCAQAQKLKSLSVEIVTADFNDKDSLSSAIAGAHGCFVVTKTDFSSNALELNMEIQHGKNIADVLKASHIQHVIYSTQLNTQQIIGMIARHMVAKSEVEIYMKNIGLPVTGVIIPCHYEQLLDMHKPKANGTSNEYSLAIPMGSTPLDIISVADIGKVVRQIFRDRNRYLDKTLSIAGDKLSVKEMAATLSKYMRPKLIKDSQVTANDYAQMSGDWRRDYAVMFQFLTRVDQKYNVKTTKDIVPDVQNFESWVRENTEKLNAVIQ